MNIIELAKQAGFTERSGVIRTVHSNGSWVGINDELQAFANLVIEAHESELKAQNAVLVEALEHAEPWLDGLTAGDVVRAALAKVGAA